MNMDLKTFFEGYKNKGGYDAFNKKEIEKLARKSGLKLKSASSKQTTIDLLFEHFGDEYNAKKDDVKPVGTVKTPQLDDFFARFKQCGHQAFKWDEVKVIARENLISLGAGNVNKADVIKLIFEKYGELYTKEDPCMTLPEEPITTDLKSFFTGYERRGDQAFTRVELEHIARKNGLKLRNNCKKQEIINLIIQEFSDIKVSQIGIDGDAWLITDKGVVQVKNFTFGKLWNGEEFTNAKRGDPFTSTPYSVLFSEMSEVIGCGLRFIIKNALKVSSENYVAKLAQELRPGKTLDEILPQAVQYPQVECEGDDMKDSDPYTNGFYSADGTESQHEICLHGNSDGPYKKLLEPHIKHQLYHRTKIDKRYTDPEIIICLLDMFKMMPKYYVPINGKTTNKLQWLAGFADGDGNLKYEADKITGINLSSTNLTMLKDIKLMLSTLGCRCKINLLREKDVVGDKIRGIPVMTRQRQWGMTIPITSLTILRKKGLDPKRLKLPAIISGSQRERYIYVKEVKQKSSRQLYPIILEDKIKEAEATSRPSRVTLNRNRFIFVNNIPVKI
jgi:LAGLIDADG-like domain